MLEIGLLEVVLWVVTVVAGARVVVVIPRAGLLEKF